MIAIACVTTGCAEMYRKIRFHQSPVLQLPVLPQSPLLAPAMELQQVVLIPALMMSYRELEIDLHSRGLVV